MRRLQVRIWMIVCMMFISVLTNAQSTFLEENSDSFIEFKKLSTDFFDAVKNRDSVTMALILADEFTLTSSESNGEVMRKRGYINGSLQPDILVVKSFEMHSFKMRLYDKMAIIQSIIDWKSDYFGQPWNADFLITDVMVYRDSRWQIVHRHSSYPVDYLSKAVEMRNRN